MSRMDAETEGRETKPNGPFDTRGHHARMTTGDRPICKPICQPKGVYR